MFHPGWRERALSSLGEPFDLVIIGGGITGCGIFFDASQRGLRALLVERGDIACGTSSRSSKLIHGGLRYLKHMHFRVTQQSCRERDRQLVLHPHLVSPLRWIYPAYRGDRPPGWQVEWGLRLYDRLTQWPDKHGQLDAEELAELLPGLSQENLDRVLTYFDGRADDARLTLAVAASGLAAGGSLLTRTEPLEGIRDPGGRLKGLVLRDAEDGQTHRVEASLVVNAAGTWVDTLRHRLGFEGATLRPSRGSHILFSSDTLPLDAAVTVPSPDDRRPVFCIPHPEGVLVGTTDLFHDGDLDDPRPTQGEVDYLLRAANHVFPGRELGLGHVEGSFAGLRPVLDHGSDNPSAASREEAVWHEEGLLSVAGGKLTTWRAMAEDVVDTALDHLPDARVRRLAPCSTDGTPLAGLAPADLDQRLRAVHGLQPEVASGLARRLGSLAWWACEWASDPKDLQPLAPGVDLCAAEVHGHVRFGGVLHISDLLLRRVRYGMWTPTQARDLLPNLRRPMRRAMGWSYGRWDREVEDYLRDARAWSPEGIVP